LRLLSLVTNAEPALSLADLSQRLTLPKPTVHRLCLQLVETGHLMRDIKDRTFMPGPALRRLAMDTLNQSTLRGLRHTVLGSLVESIGETCNFTTLDGTEVLYLDRVEAHWPLRLTLEVGAHVPLHCTASGKLFLATMSEEKRDTLISRSALLAQTQHTLTDADALRAECRRILECGYSTDCEEFIAGLVAVAVPIFDASGIVRAALAVHAPSARMSMAQMIKRLPVLRDAAQRMASLL
jgi:IclR family transcriptional regulator, acetate operon repressor